MQALYSYIHVLLLQALQQVDDGWKPIKKKDQRSNHSVKFIRERDEKCLDAPQVRCSVCFVLSLSHSFCRVMVLCLS